MKYFLGIDGGGTKTVVAVSDESGNILMKKTGKSINFYSVGLDTARKNLGTVIDDIRSELRVQSFFGVFIGCSALDDEADAKLVSELTDGVIDAEKIKIHSDVYIALKSVEGAECPCAAICGTGSMAAAFDKDGNSLIAGGWGHIIGDEGSAYAISLEALKKCCIMSDKGIKTPLLECAEKHFGVSDFRKIIDVIYSPETTKDVIALFAEKVGDLASDGNADAVGIIKNQAELFADTVLTLVEKAECDVVGLFGSVFKHNKLFSDTFSEKLKQHYLQIKVKPADIPAEESALKLAREL